MKAKEMGDLMAYDDLVARVYADKRADPGTREVLLAFGWALLRDPGRRFDKDKKMGGVWARMCNLLGPASGSWYQWRLEQLIAEDAPRYEPPSWRAGPCIGPRMRPYKPRGHNSVQGGYNALGQRVKEPEQGAALVCGRQGVVDAVERDPVTGWVTRHWFCRRHEACRDELEARFRAVKAPPPIPNRGGLLPCYFRADWTAVYQELSTRWEPPFHGVCADDWPVPGAEDRPVPSRPRLRLLVGGGNTDAGSA